MATCNFRQPILNKVYTIALESENDFDYEDEKSNVVYGLKTIKGFEEASEQKWTGRDRLILGSFYINLFDKYYKQWTDARINITVESGYYSGAMIDIDLSEVEEYEINKTTQAKIDRVKRQVEKVLEANCLPLRRVAVFSNGEAIYERA